MTKLEMENRLVVARSWGFGGKKGAGYGYKSSSTGIRELGLFSILQWWSHKSTPDKTAQS